MPSLDAEVNVFSYKMQRAVVIEAWQKGIASRYQPLMHYCDILTSLLMGQMIVHHLCDKVDEETPDGCFLYGV